MTIANDHKPARAVNSLTEKPTPRKRTHTYRGRCIAGAKTNQTNRLRFEISSATLTLIGEVHRCRQFTTTGARYTRSGILN